MEPDANKPKIPELNSEFIPDTQNNMKPLPMPELRAFAKNVWIADGPDVRDMGVMFTTRMTIVKLADGSCWVESPVPVSFDTLKDITELGPVKYLVAATPRHVWRLDGWHTLFPEAQLWTARTTLYTLKKGNLPITGILGDTPDQGWADDFDQLAFKGSSSIEEVLFFHRQSHTVILDDLIQTHMITKGKPFLNALLKLSDAIDPHGGVGIDMRTHFHESGSRAALARKAAFVGLRQIDHRAWSLHRERREGFRRTGLPMARALTSTLI